MASENLMAKEDKDFIFLIPAALDGDSINEATPDDLFHWFYQNQPANFSNITRRLELILFLFCSRFLSQFPGLDSPFTYEVL